MRIAVGQMWQETNSFNRNPTRFADFEASGFAVGDEVVGQYGRTSDLAGFLTTCQEWKPDVRFVGLARCKCWPWGAVESEAGRRIRETFQTALAEAGEVDAVFLALHGAMAADDEPDLTGALLERVRAVVGPDVPVVGSLDLHANITRRMVEHADVLVGYHASPHLDTFETGQRTARALIRMLDDGVRPVKYWRKLPMITAAELHDTFTGPPAPLYRRLEQLETEQDVLTAGIYMAMPWLDGPSNGWTVTLTTTGRDARWRRTVDDLCAGCWDLRKTLNDVRRFSPAEVVQKALEHGGHPIVIGDGANATNSGAAGDSTHLLREFLKQDSIPHGALLFLVDPDAVAVARQMGVGGTFNTAVGGTFSPEYSEPIQFRGTVEHLLDVRFVLNGHGGSNLPIDMGGGAVVRSGDVTVLFTETGGPGSSPALYESAGLDPRTYGIVVALSPAGFRAEYGPFAADILLADCPGPATPNWHRLNFLHVNRPLWPLDDIDRPQQAVWVDD